MWYILKLLHLLLICATFYSVFPQTKELSVINKTGNYTQTFGRGELKIVEGIPFLKLSGSYYEMGVQYGTLMKEKIKEVVEYKKVKDFIKNNSHPPKWLVKLCTPNRYLDFIEGISDGSGISYDEIFWINAAPDPVNCSSIITKLDNKILLGHNQDRLMPGKYKAIIEFNPENSLKYIVSTYIGTSDLMIGMNEKGVCLCNDGANFTVNGYGLFFPSTKYMPAICKYREILENASVIKDVDELFDGYRADANILSVASGSENDGAIYDIAYKKIRKNTFNDKDYLFATNQYLNSDLDDHPENCPRYKLIGELIHNKPVKSVTDMIEILSDPGTFHGINNHSTIHSIVFDPKELQIYFSLSSDYAAWGKWLKYNWMKGEVSVIKEESKKYDSVFIKKFDAVTIASIRDSIISPSDQGKMYSRLYSFFRRNKIDVPIPAFTLNYGSKGGKSDIEAAVIVPKLYPDSGEIKFKKLPEIEVAYIIHKGNEHTLQRAYDLVYSFVKENNYEISGPTMQAYLKGDWNVKNPDEWITTIRVPIKRKTDN